MTPAVELIAQGGRKVTQTETMRENAALSIRGLTATYGSSPAIFSIDADFRTGRISAIIGPNGPASRPC